ncbi:MAG: hypothetical protein M2R45_03214 [Verrucomicrobia subdivision 3 bacterium]|nr:hypothetical protein [Limisphaerales bacterium]MCS1413929.1 hypothetical protein [Limisphaerales bacterium]
MEILIEPIHRKQMFLNIEIFRSLRRFCVTLLNNRR